MHYAADQMYFYEPKYKKIGEFARAPMWWRIHWAKFSHSEITGIFI